jgi:hypothetical protein
VIVSDGMGGAIVCWFDDRAGAAGIYARAVAADGTLRWPTAGTTVCAASGAKSGWIMAEDTAGGAVFAWVDGRSLGTSGKDIYAQRVDRDGVVKWTSNGVVVCNAPLDQDFLTATSDGVGGIIAAWEDPRGTTPIDTFYVYAGRISPQGANYVTGVASQPIASHLRHLEQNRPNPFNPRTTVRFHLPRSGGVQIAIFDASGRLVRRLLNAHKEAGRHEVPWDGLDARGRMAPSGVYYYRLETQGIRETRKMALAK